MQKIDREEFVQNEGNPMSGVSAPETRYFRSDSGDELATVFKREDGRFVASVLRPSDYYDGQKRTDDTESFNKRKDWEDAIKWVEEQFS